MAVKAILQNLEGLSEELSKQYKQVDGVGYVLDVEGVEAHPMVGALARAKERESTEATAAKKALRELQDAHKALTEKHGALSEEFEAKLRGAQGTSQENVARLDKSWGEKMGKQKDDFEKIIGQQERALQKLLIQDAAQQVAIAMKPLAPEHVGVLLPHITCRLAVERDGDTAKTRVLDLEGKPTALTIEELASQMSLDKRFAPLLTGSRASGSSAPGAGPGGSAPGPIAKPDFRTATPAQIDAWMEQEAAAGR